MLVLTLDREDDFVKIGDDITIYFAPYSDATHATKIRVKIDAPRNINISRRQAIEKRQQTTKE